MQFLAERLEGGVPQREPMLAVLIKRHYREHDLTGLRELQVGARPFAVADYTLDGRAHPPRDQRRPGRRARRPAASSTQAVTAQLAERREGARGRRRPLPVLARRAGRRPRTPRRALARAPGRYAVRPAGAARRRRGLPRWRPAGRLLHLPSGRRRDDGRGPARPRGAPHGRPAAQPVAAARLRGHPARGPRGRAALPAAPRPATRPTSASSRWRRCASSPWSATSRAGSPPCRTPSGPSPTASRRSAGPASARGAAGARLDMNHVWVHIWPPIEADLDQLTALQAKIAPLTAGAGIEEVLVQGRIAAPGRCQRAARGPVPLPARLGRRHLGRGAADRAARSRSTTTRRRSSGPGGAASSTPTSCRP